MAIKNSKINPLNVLGIRRVNFPAHHFAYVNLTKCNTSFLNEINNWIKANTTGRYYVGSTICITYDNTIVYSTRVGFENKKELSFFNLACPHAS